MDDERKMSDEKRTPGTELVDRSKMVFLQEIVEEFQEKQAQYDLQAEFAKTKKNRSFMVPGVILGLIVLFSLIVVAVTQYIQTSSRAIQVDIDDFSDVNLREVLDEAQRLQNELEAVQRELRQTETELSDAVGRVERERDRAVRLLQDQNLTAGQRNARRQELEAQAASEIESLQAQYEPRIAALQEEIELLQEQIAQYDSRQLEQAREQEEVLNNQQRIAELEKQELREQYETEIDRLTATYESEIAELEQFQDDFEQTIRQSHADEIAALRRQHRQELNELFVRYNPQFTDGNLLGLLEHEVPTPDDPAAAIAPYSPLLGMEGVANRSEYAALRRRYEELSRIIGRLEEIPYEGSVAPAIAQLEQRSYDLIQRYERLWTGLRDTVIDRDTIIAARDDTIDEQRAEMDQLLFALEELTRINGETGYILDPRNPDEIVVYVSRNRNVREGALGYVFRRDDAYVGSVRFVRRDGRIVAERAETVEEMEFRPFDKILVEAQ